MRNSKSMNSGLMTMKCVAMTTHMSRSVLCTIYVPACISVCILQAMYVRTVYSFDYNTPYIVALGHQRIIPGMDRGLAGMCLWERRRVSFPPHLGYGSRGVGDTIPPNSSLVFYVRLIKIERVSSFTSL